MGMQKLLAIMLSVDQKRSERNILYNCIFNDFRIRNFFNMAFLTSGCKHKLTQIIALFFLLSVLSDPLRTQYASIASILQWILILLILKSIWGLVSPPTGQSTTITRALVILCILGKVLLIFLLFLLKGSDE